MDTHDLPEDVLAKVRAEVMQQVRSEIKAEVASALTPRSPADDDPTIRERILATTSQDELVALVREANASYDAQKVTSDG